MASRAEVSAIIEQLLERLDKPHQDLTDETHLYGEGLGLDSLETAELSATFEDQFGSDPFSAGGRMPQTVGDIMAFYGATSDL